MAEFELQALHEAGKNLAFVTRRVPGIHASINIVADLLQQHRSEHSIAARPVVHELIGNQNAIAGCNESTIGAIQDGRFDQFDARQFTRSQRTQQLFRRCNIGVHAEGLSQHIAEVRPLDKRLQAIDGRQQSGLQRQLRGLIGEWKNIAHQLLLQR